MKESFEKEEKKIEEEMGIGIEIEVEGNLEKVKLEKG